MKKTVYFVVLSTALVACGGNGSSSSSVKDKVNPEQPVTEETKKPELRAEVLKQTESIAILRNSLTDNTDNKITALVWTVKDAPNGSKLKNQSIKAKPNTLSNFIADVKGTYHFLLKAEGTDLQTELTVDTSDKDYDVFHQLNIKTNEDSVIPQLSDIKAKAGVNFICVLQEKPSDSQAKIDSTTCKIAADKVGDYRISSLHVEETGITAHEYIVRSNDTDFNIQAIDFEPVDVKYSTALDAMVMLDTEKSLHVFQGGTKLKSIALPTTAVSLDVSDDGKYAAVSHDARASYIDLVAGKVIKTFITPNSFSGITIDNDLKGIGIPTRDQWVSSYFIDYKAGTYKKPTSYSSVSAGTLLTKKGSYIYGIDVGSSPTDISRFKVTDEKEVLHYDSSYHGDFPMCGKVWLFENAKRVATGCSTTFYTSDVKEKDMLYAGSFKFSKGVKAFSHHAGKKEILISPNSLNKEAAFYERKGTDVVYTADDTYLDLKKTTLLPKVSFSANTKYTKESAIYWIYHNNVGSKYNAIVKITDKNGAKPAYMIVSEK